MINLLPTPVKESYRYARRNHYLLRWVFVLSFGLIGAVLLVGAGYFYLHQTTKQYEDRIAVAEADLKTKNFTETQKEVNDISNNLKLAKQVLSKQILFSELLKQLGTLMPKDTRLAGLSILSTTGGIDILAKAKTYTAATQIQVNLTDTKNKVFSKADIVSINCDSASADDDYVCSVTLRALFAPNNPFMLIGDSTQQSGVSQ